MKNYNKNGLRFVLLAVMMLTMVFYGCADDGGGSGLTGIDAEAAGFASSSSGITLPASIENADTMPADDIDMRTSTGDTTTNEEWFTDQDSVDTSITLPDSVSKSMAKINPEDISNYSVYGYYINENGSSNIAFTHYGDDDPYPIFWGTIPSTNDTGYFCFVVSKTNTSEGGWDLLFRSHFRKITRVDGVANLNASYDGAYHTIDVVWTNPTNGSPFGGTNQVWYGTNGAADNLVGSVTSEGFSFDILFDPYSVPFIVRVVSLDENGKPYAASASGLPD